MPREALEAPLRTPPPQKPRKHPQRAAAALLCAMPSPTEADSPSERSDCDEEERQHAGPFASLTLRPARNTQHVTRNT